MENTVFSPAQIRILRMFDYVKSDEELNELQSVISDYYAKKLDAMTEKMWASGELDQKRLDEIGQMDLHKFLRENKE